MISIKQKIFQLTIALLLLSGNMFYLYADRQLNVPIYGQRWADWSNDQLGTCSLTIGSHGCAITSTAMVFSYYGINVNPRQLNDWLKSTNGGYSGGCLINWSVAADYTSGKVQWAGSNTDRPIDLNLIKQDLDNGYPVIAGVGLGEQHFVVITGYSGSTFYINDPWYGDASTIDRYGSNPENAIYGIRRYHGQSPINPGGGYASISNGVNISPSTVSLGEDFTVSFTLKEVRGGQKILEQVAIDILDSNGNHLFNFSTFDNVVISAYGTWPASATNYLFDTRPPGTYQVMVRGKVDGQWFDFDCVESGVNPKYFEAVEGGGELPDLIVRDIYLTDDRTSFSTGESVRIYARIKNIGEADVSNDIRVKYYLSNGENIDDPPVYIDDDIVDNKDLTAGHSGYPDKGFTIPSTSGTYNITIFADADNNVEESYENNNWYNPPLVFTVNASPQGSFDGADCKTISGWARDPDTTNPINVHIYIDGPAGTGTFLQSVTADNYRGDLPYSDKNHGFSIVTPGTLFDETDHSIYIYAIDSNGGTNPLLNHSPRTINCENPIEKVMPIIVNLLLSDTEDADKAALTTLEIVAGFDKNAPEDDKFPEINGIEKAILYLQIAGGARN